MLITFCLWSFLLYSFSVQAAAQCKSIPGSSGWPSLMDWNEFNTTVKGRLLKPDPPAATCHDDYDSYSLIRCAALKIKFLDSTWHAAHPTSNMWQNYNNYSCTPTSESCTGSGLPIYVVEAHEPMDVKAAVDFARTKNIRLNIKSTGHDFLGRSVQPNSLSIWTHHLKTTQWHEKSFSPKGCDLVIDGPAVTAGSGSQWGELNAEADKRKLALVSGGFNSVSLGGFLSNGGHGGLSAKYGFGADMVLQIELVTPSGEIITANECQNTDYFWAMRGGGGSTYGVALTYTLKALPTFRTAMWIGFASGWDEIAYLHSQWPKLAAVGASGYMMGYLPLITAVPFYVTLPNATIRQLKSILDPITDSLDGWGVDDPPAAGNSSRLSGRRGNYTEFDSWGQAEPHVHSRQDKTNDSTQGLYKRAQEGITDYFPGMGSNKLLVSWLYSAADVQHPNLKEALKAALSESGTIYLNDATMGVGTQNPPYLRGGGNAVNPALRTAVMRPAAEMQWLGNDPAVWTKKREVAQKLGASLRSISPNGGTYANEADPDTPNWQHAFWGSNYDRLLRIKKMVDPEGVFYCRRCVGSEFFEDHDGILCRK
ncbi:FAD-binding domain-containing protein [Microthyrium microscopicum]|uniref:FAD-binding domain-containing protein n=1 Tax=Microthyrium microscopicum TaxID=703497 RepID=A0A6A6U982_9PEZI|nr:FAD-binding domain-containing protein [Microthyrium microscopicum]